MTVAGHLGSFAKFIRKSNFRSRVLIIAKYHYCRDFQIAVCLCGGINITGDISSRFRQYRCLFKGSVREK